MKQRELGAIEWWCTSVRLPDSIGLQPTRVSLACRLYQVGLYEISRAASIAASGFEMR